jgi:trehalose 6-phosphate synthase
MMSQLRENNVSVWRDNFMRDLQSANGAARTASARPRARVGKKTAREIVAS